MSAPDLTVSELMDLMIAKDFTEAVIGQVMLKRESRAKAVVYAPDTLAPPPMVDPDLAARLKAEEDDLLYASSGG